MNAADRIPLGEREDVDVVLQIFVVIAKAVSAKARFIEPQRVDHRAHRAIEHENPPGQEVAEHITPVGGRGGVVWRGRLGGQGEIQLSRGRR